MDSNRKHGEHVTHDTADKLGAKVGRDERGNKEIVIMWRMFCE